MNEAAGKCLTCKHKDKCMESDRGISCTDYYSQQEYEQRCRKAAEEIRRLNKEAK